MVDFSIATNFQVHIFRERVHHGEADPVEPAGYPVTQIIEFAPGMELRHNDLERWFLLLLVVVYGYSPAIILYRHTIINVDC